MPNLGKIINLRSGNALFASKSDIYKSGVLSPQSYDHEMTSMPYLCTVYNYNKNFTDETGLDIRVFFLRHV